MIRLRSLAPAAALTLGLLSIASAQEINTDVTGTAGAAAKAAQSGSSAATNTQTNGQIGQGAANVNANQKTDANVDLNAPNTPTAETEATADGAENYVGDATEEARESTRQQTDALNQNRNQIDTEADADTDSSLDADAADNATRLGNETDAAANTQADGLQNSAAGMTFRSNTDSIIVDNVADGSAASRLGLKSGDEIVRFNGQWVSNTQELQRMMNNVQSSRPVDISFRRDGRQMGRQIQLDAGMRTSSAMRPNYDQSEGSMSGAADVNGSTLVDGQVNGEAMHHGNYSNYSNGGRSHFGHSYSGYQSNLNYSQTHGYASNYDLHHGNCCCRLHRRHRRCCR